MLSLSSFSPQQMAGCPRCPVLLEQMSSPQWLLWPENASRLPPSTPASPSSSPSTSPCATRTTAPSPTVHPRTTSYCTSAWAGRGRARGEKGHNQFSILLDFPVSCWCRSTYRFTRFPPFGSRAQLNMQTFCDQEGAEFYTSACRFPCQCTVCDHLYFRTLLTYVQF